VNDGMADRSIVIAERITVLMIKNKENCESIVKMGKITLLK
jgi:hypothetical protein